MFRALRKQKGYRTARAKRHLRPPILRTAEIFLQAASESESADAPRFPVRMRLRCPEKAARKQLCRLAGLGCPGLRPTGRALLRRLIRNRVLRSGGFPRD